MREKASQQDAQDVVEIMKYSLLDTFSDDFGNLDFQRSQHGSGMSSRAQVRFYNATTNKSDKFKTEEEKVLNFSLQNCESIINSTT